MNIIRWNVTHSGFKTIFNEIAKHETKLPIVGTRINPHHVLKDCIIFKMDICQHHALRL